MVSVPRDGRYLPIWWTTIEKQSGDGVQVQAEKVCLLALKQLYTFHSHVIVVADRGFGNTRWLRDISKVGMGYVQRISGSIYIENPRYYRSLNELPISRGDKSKDWGSVTLTKEDPFRPDW